MTSKRKPYKTYTREFKLEALRLMEVSERPSTEIAMELGIRRNQLYKWKEQLTMKREAAFTGKGRPVGGWLADRLGGARVTFWNFIVMTGAVFGVLYFLPGTNGDGSFWGFLTMFIVLFITTGIGNGSTFRMIPIIFMTEHECAAAAATQPDMAQVKRDAIKESAAVLGFSSAVAAYGAFFVPKSYGTSINLTGGVEAALYLFVVFYVSCIAMTWWYYSRKHAEVPC